MRLGATILPTDRSIAPDRLAAALEAHGFDSLFVAEHTHMPVQHTPYRGGEQLPEEYRRTLDPFVALTQAATASTELELGTGICLVAQRDPIVLAKQVASLDLACEGRVLLGVGYGWNRPEAEHHGVAFGSRRDVLREKILAMKRLWTEEEAAYDGDHVSFGPSWSWPKPVRDPHPPMLLGASAGTATFEHVIEFCDGWMPMGARSALDGAPALRRMAEDRGRDPGTISVTVYGTRFEPRRLEELLQAGIDRSLLWLPSAPEEEILDVIGRHSELMEDLT